MKNNDICIEGGILMKEDCLHHLFVPPEKSTTERISDAVEISSFAGKIAKKNREGDQG